MSDIGSALLASHVILVVGPAHPRLVADAVALTSVLLPDDRCRLLGESAGMTRSRYPSAATTSS